jgi:hypothetical protein
MRVILRDAQMKAVDLTGSRMRGVELVDVEISGELQNVVVNGVDSPWHPLDLPWDEAPGWDGIPWDRKARPSLDEVLTVRRERQAMVRHVLASLTDAQLAADVTRIEPGWPRDLDTLRSAARVWD